MFGMDPWTTMNAKQRTVKFGLTLCALLLTRCSGGGGDAGLSWYSELSGATITGKALISDTSVGLSVGDAGAACVKTASLYAFNADGSVSATPLKTVPLADDNTYIFKGVTSLGVNPKSETVAALIRIDACGSSFSRPLTGSTAQDVSVTTTLVEQISKTSDTSVKKINTVSTADMRILLATIGTLPATNLTEAYDVVRADSTAKTTVETTFALSFDDVKYLTPPTLDSFTAPASLAEGSSAAYSVVASNWYSGYSFAYEWSLNGALVSTTASYSYVPTKNSQGSQSLTLKVGLNTAGALDTAKPYTTKLVTLTVPDTFPAVVPALSLTSASPTNSLSVTMNLATGAAFANCATFSGMAMTENSLVAPLSPASYASGTGILCTTAGTQSVAWTLGTGDGTKTLRLWARDAAGNLSASAQSVSVVVDQTAPVLGLTDVATALSGGAAYSVNFSATDATSGVQSATLYYAADGTTFVSVADVTGLTTYPWTVPATDTSTAKFKIVAVDGAGNSNSKTSAAFVIDASPPSAPTATLSSSSPTNSLNTTLAVTCTAAYDKILITESTSAPAGSDSGWQACSSSMLFTLAAGDGNHTIKVWSKKASGNISTTGTSVTVNVDQTSPTLTLNTDFTGKALSGHASSSAPTLAISWTAADAHFGTTPISLSYSVDNGSTWTPIVTMANSSSYTWTIPNVSGAQSKFKISAVDSLGNPATAVISPAFIIDSALPTISALSITAGTYVSSNAQAFALTSADNVGIAAYRFGTSATLTTAPWLTSLPTSYTFPLASGTYSLYVQVKDAAGNLSTVVQSSNSITITLGLPPLVNVIKPVGGSNFPSAPSTVHVSWNIATQSPVSLVAAGVTVKYSLDRGASTKDWATTLLVGQNGSCTVDAGATGCADLALPAELAGAIFQIVVFASDVGGAQGLAMSPSYNATAGLTLLAGKNSFVMGGQAVASSLAYRGGIARHPGTGDIYFNQLCNISKIDAKTGVLTTFAGDAARKDCSFSAEGLAPTDIRFNNSYTEYAMTFDDGGNLYWLTNDPGRIYKHTVSTGLADVYVGCVETPCSNATGTLRRKFNISSSGVREMFAGYGGMIYFSVDVSIVVSGVTVISRAVYQVDPATDKVNLMAGGTPSFTTPSASGDLAATVDARTRRVSTFSVIPGNSSTADTLLLMNTADEATGSQSIWKLGADFSPTAMKTYNCGSTPTFLKYLSGRGKVGLMSAASTIHMYDPTANTLTCNQITVAVSSNTKAIDGDDYGGVYYTNSLSTQIYFASSANASSTYAGAASLSGDGGKAIYAEIRSPAYVTQDLSGNIYLNDVGNNRIRKIDTSGNISSTASASSTNAIIISTGPIATPWLVDVYTSQLGLGKGFFSAAAPTANLLFKGASTEPFICTTATAADAVNHLSMTSTGTNFVNGGAMAADGTSKYFYVQERLPGNVFRTYLKKVLANNSMSEIAGNSAATAGAIVAMTAGTMAGNQVGAVTYMKAASSTVFVFDDKGKIIYSGEDGGAWVAQVTGFSAPTNFAINPSTRTMYYFKGNDLYRKYYATNASGSAQIIANFDGVLVAPVVNAYSSTTATPTTHTLIIHDGNSIYTFTDTTNID
jgi:hypothetical protein